MLCVADAESARLGFGRRKTAEAFSHPSLLYSLLFRVASCVAKLTNVWWSHLRKPMPQQRRRRAISGAN